MSEKSRAMLDKLRQSFTTKIIALIITVIFVPLAAYQILEKAEIKDTMLAITDMQNDGRLITEGLRPLIADVDPVDLPAIIKKMKGISLADLRLQLLVNRGGASGKGEFEFVVAVPSEPVIEENHILDALPEALQASCLNHTPLAVPLVDSSGKKVILTSLNPILSISGCWIVAVSHIHQDAIDFVFDRPYWEKPEVQIVAAVYLAMSLIILALFVAARRSLKGFEATANDIRRQRIGASFVSSNKVPELEGVAESFDTLISSLKSSAQAMRRAAEENAHAFKTPIATIAQAVEPLKRGIPEDKPQLRRSLEIIERSINRLDALVSTARRLEEVAAELVHPVLRPIDLSVFVSRIGDNFSTFHKNKGLKLKTTVTPGIIILGDEDMIEVILENLFDNAADFSPPNGIISLKLERHGDHAVLTVEDSGPGCPPEDLPRLFDRYFTHRPERKEGPGVENFGIGLWIVRHNAEALGGEIHAENRQEGGLRHILTLPLNKA